MSNPVLYRQAIGICALWLLGSGEVARELKIGAPCRAYADMASDQAAIDRFIAEEKFDHAEMLCREQLQSDISVSRRAAFTVELLRVLTEKARQSTLQQAEQLFQDAHEVAKAYLEIDRASNLRWLVEFQMALLPRLHGDLRQWQAAGSRGDANHLGDLRATLKQLESLASRMDRAMRSSSRLKSQGGLSENALRELRGRVALEIGITYRMQAEAYAADGDDRLLAAAQGVKTLERISPTSMTLPWWWRSRIELLACLRLKSDYKTVKRQMEVLQAGKMPAHGKVELQAEAIRAALGQQDWESLKSLLATGAASLEVADPSARHAVEEVTLAYVESFLALAAHAADTEDQQAARDYGKRAAAIVEECGNASEYWTRRVEFLLAAEARNTGANFSLGLAARTARGLYREGRSDEAAAAYRQAADQALAAGEPAEALALTMTAASVLITKRTPSQPNHAPAKDVRTAITWLRQAATAQPGLPAAPNAHLLAIKLLAQLKTVSETVSNPPDAPRDDATVALYRELLDEHLQKWPRASSADQVAWWRGRTRESSRDFAGAMTDYLKISADFPGWDQLVPAIENCAAHLSIDSDDAADAADAADRTDAAADWIEPAVERLLAIAEADTSDAMLKKAAALAAVRTGRMADSSRVVAGFEQAVLTLRRHLELSTDSDAPVGDGHPASATQDADSLRLVVAESLFWMGKSSEAADMLHRVESAKASDWLGTLVTADRWAATRKAADASSVRWRLELIRRGRSVVNDLNPSQRRVWDRLELATLMDQGTHAALLQAADRIRPLLKQSPQDAQLHEWNAQILTATGDADQALKAWRTVVAGSPPQSPRWYRAKLQLAKLHIASGNPDRAVQMIRLLQALHPDLGGPEQKARFVKLLEAAQGGE